MPITAPWLPISIRTGLEKMARQDAGKLRQGPGSGWFLDTQRSSYQSNGQGNHDRSGDPLHGGTTGTPRSTGLVSNRIRPVRVRTYWRGSNCPRCPFSEWPSTFPLLSSPGMDGAPVVTDHGDFLYFASTREEGFGGSDVYRSRLIGGEPVKPYNLGEEINGPANETHPAVRMAGFHLLFNSDRNGNPYDLYQAKSKRVVGNSITPRPRPPIGSVETPSC